MEEIKNSNKTIILYEAPHKLKNTLNDLKDILKDRKIVIAREITKIHEEYIRGTVDEIFKIVDNLKGEMILIIDKNENINKIEDDLNNLTLEEHYEFYKNKKKKKKEIIKKIAKDRNVNKNEIYKMFINKE